MIIKKQGNFVSKKLQNMRKFIFLKDGSTILNFKKNPILLIKRHFFLNPTWSLLKKL